MAHARSDRAPATEHSRLHPRRSQASGDGYRELPNLCFREQRVPYVAQIAISLARRLVGDHLPNTSLTKQKRARRQSKSHQSERVGSFRSGRRAKRVPSSMIIASRSPQKGNWPTTFSDLHQFSIEGTAMDLAPQSPRWSASELGGLAKRAKLIESRCSCRRRIYKLRPDNARHAASRSRLSHRYRPASKRHR